MGHRSWHVARAEHNKKAADSFLSDFPDWACTALFYSALHYVHSALADEAPLPKDERHPRKHTAIGGQDLRGVNQLVRDLYPSIYRSYRSLYDLSRRTRYDIDALSKSVASGVGLEDRTAFTLATVQWEQIKALCLGLNQGRSAMKARDV